MVATIEASQTTAKFSKAVVLEGSDASLISKGSIARIIEGDPEREKKTGGLFGLGSGDSDNQDQGTGKKISNM